MLYFSYGRKCYRVCAPTVELRTALTVQNASVQFVYA